jgi:hypothetical protein
MPQSKKRGGAKAHRKKVSSRNETIKKQQGAIQKLFEESIKQQVEELKKKHAESSGNTVSDEGVESV